MDIFNHSLESFAAFKFLPITEDAEPAGEMSEKWEMVFSQINRISVWRFVGPLTEWYCLDLFVGDRHDSFEMSQFEGIKWTHKETLWLATLPEVIEFVATVAELNIDEAV